MRARDFRRRRLRLPAPHGLGPLPISAGAVAGARVLSALALALVPCAALGLGGMLALLAAATAYQCASEPGPCPCGQDVDRPDFDGYDTLLETPSVANLSRSLTINGQTVQPTFWYKGEDASGTTWPAEVGGADGLLTEAGSGASPSYAQGVPLMGTDAAVKYNAAKYHLAPAGGAFGDIGTEDFVVEMVFRHGSVVNETYLDKRTGSVLYTIYNPAGASIRLYLNDGAGHTASISSSTLTVGAWYHAIWFVDRSGSAQIYYNLSAAGGAADVSSVGTLTNNGRMSAGGTNTGGGLLNTVVSHMAMWKRSAWLDTHLQATIAAQRFRALTGSRPQTNTTGRDAAPLNWSRNSVATLQKYNPTTDADEMYSVGPYWPRCERWRNADGSTFTGFRPELTRTNLLTYSHVTEATWTKADAGDTTAAANGPWGAGTAEGWVADATDGDHSRLLACTTTAAVHAAYVRVKAGTCPVVAIHDSVSNVGRYFVIATGALGGAMGGAPTVSYTVDNRSGWMTCCMVWTATAAARNVRVYPCDADGDPTTTGDGSAVSIYFAHAQVEAGDCHSSAIRTSGGTAQRLKDELEYTITGPGAQGAVVYDAVIGVTYAAGGPGATAGYHINVSDAGTTNRMLAQATGDTISSTVCTDGAVTGAAWTALTPARIGVAWKANRHEQWRNGALDGTVDTAVTAPGAMNQIALGQSYASASQPSVPTLIRRVRVYRRYQPGMAALTRL